MAGTNSSIFNLDSTKLTPPSMSVLTKIQSHGILLVLQEPNLKILQVSNNTIESLGIAPNRLIGQPLEHILDVFQVEKFRVSLTGKNFDSDNYSKVWIERSTNSYRIFDAVLHRSPDGSLILELEPTEKDEHIPFLSFYHLAKASIDRLTTTVNLPVFGQIVVTEVRKMTGFDRVMLYKFGARGHGEVIAEDKVAEMESYLALRFPASDIPAPAREMFLANRIRVIPDLHNHSVEMMPAHNPLTNQPTDLTLAILRSTVPCHTQYLLNMGVSSSLTISLLKDGHLWGMINCHHRTAKLLSYELRKACELLGQVIFAEISTIENIADSTYRSKLAQDRAVAIDRMSRSASFVDGLMGYEPNLLDLCHAEGAATYCSGKWTTIGQTPPAAALEDLLRWLIKNVQDDVFTTDSLPLLNLDFAGGVSALEHPEQQFKAVASGLLAIAIPPSNYILCFRPEVIQAVNWGGDPTPADVVVGADGNVSPSPRASFELWKETVRLHSLPWQAVEIQSAVELRSAIVKIILHQSEQLALLAIDLERSNTELKQFAYVASHDLQAPLHQVASYVQLLEARYGEKLDADAKEFIGFAVEGVNLMQTLIDDVLIYSKVNLLGSEWELVDVQVALDRALSHFREQIRMSGAIFTFDSMPTIFADSTQLTQLFQNLIGNALKFCQPDQPPQIQITVERQEHDWLFAVRDEGIGIAAEYLDRIFVIFQRLHTRDEYPGSGMGLTICKKIVECHHGKIWVKSAIGQGATFYFTIPVKNE
jgi:two-component system, chemotaxis family, sensor kinase Cph1